MSYACARTVRVGGRRRYRYRYPYRYHYRYRCRCRYRYRSAGYYFLRHPSFLARLVVFAAGLLCAFHGILFAQLWISCCVRFVLCFVLLCSFVCTAAAHLWARVMRFPLSRLPLRAEHSVAPPTPVRSDVRTSHGITRAFEQFFLFTWCEEQIDSFRNTSYVM